MNANWCMEEESKDITSAQIFVTLDSNPEPKEEVVNRCSLDSHKSQVCLRP
jgi:hypothetical protein